MMSPGSVRRSAHRDPALLRSLLRLASEISDNEPVVLIDPETASWMRDICPGINLVPDRNHFEYVYLSADLAALPGKNYLTIRRQISKFHRTCTTRLSRLPGKTGRK